MAVQGDAMSMYVSITYRRGEVSNKGVQGRWLPHLLQLLINILPSYVTSVLYIHTYIMLYAAFM